MNIYERCERFDVLFDDLINENSRNQKEYLVEQFLRQYPELKDDWTYILETLNGKHPIGWTYVAGNADCLLAVTTIKEVIQYLCNQKDHSYITQYNCKRQLGWKVGEFIAPIVNRTLRLGIGRSLLSVTNLTPMLAKKYEGESLRDEYIVTEKLDGNRCIAHYEDGRWMFTSRSGKPLKVNFNMTGLPTEYIYDGEILSIEQTNLSIAREVAIKQNDIFKVSTEMSQRLFNTTSGLINSKADKKGLVYNIFDIVENLSAYDRKSILLDLQKEIYTSDIRMLPILYVGKDTNNINHLLDVIIEMGGEGIMLNNPNSLYMHKRTDALLKYKRVKTMDMYVMDVYEGVGKYVGMTGAINCFIQTEDGKNVYCNVGSGMSDDQRYDWFMHKEKIVGKIVQIAYHELTQDRNFIGTNTYSLRFPRLIKIRNDKQETSEY